ncbi:peptide ABC transporter permease [Alsobacter sp. KACC 23698]|uniref:Peptide ABC transporter permease n=1 Tax=Alsobacter sp. KACC 23698 TaxID=3149229 RepID=A0AAU7JG73_9HYPH
MARSARPSVNPALDAAGLLRRFGFAILVVAAPLLAVGSRRGLVVAAPIGIALMVLASAIESEGRQPLDRAVRSLLTPTAGVAVFLAFWAALSLLWTPFPSEATERLLNLSASALVGLVAVSSLPDRMRVTNLYLMPIGAGLAALAALAIAWRAASGRSPDPELDRALLERGLLVTVVLAPAAVTWLLSKDRLASGFALVAAVTAALILGDNLPALVALVLGALVYACATVNPRLGRRVALALLPGLVLAAPLVPFALRPLVKLVFGVSSARADAIRVWCRIVTDQPLRLLTGHGLDTALRARLAGLLPAGSPSGLLFEIWFELGFLGAAALALLLARAVVGSKRLSPGASPGALMMLTVAFTLAALGQGAAQAWWLSTLVLGAVTIIAVDRGQYRTSRPKPGRAPETAEADAKPAPATPAGPGANRAQRPVLRP